MIDKTSCTPYLLKGDGKNAVLLLHGFTASCAAMRPLAAPLNAAGYTVFAPNLKGHGETVDAMREYGWKDWQKDALGAFDDLYSKYQHVVVIGHSMGGLLALRTAELRPVWKCVALAAGIRPRHFSQYLLPLQSPFRPELSWPKIEDDPYNGIGYDSFPTAKFYDLNRLALMARFDLRQIRCPLLCVTAEQDESAHPSCGKILMDGVSSREKERLHLKNSAHSLQFGSEIDTVTKKLLEFLSGDDRPAHPAPKV